MNELNRLKIGTIRLSAKPLILILPGLFYLANLIRMLQFSTVPYFITLYVIGAMGFLMAIFSKKYKLGNILVFFLLYGLTLVVNWLTIGNISFNDIAVNVLLIGITLVMLINQWTYREGIIIFYATAIAVAYAINTRTIVRIFGSSNNYISIVLILAVAFYYIALENDEKKIKLFDLIPALVCFYLSIVATGRGGILSTAVLVVLILFIYAKSFISKHLQRFIVVALIFLLGGFMLYISNISLLETFMGLGKWGTRGADNSARMLIWGNYFDKMGESVGYILAGAPLRDIPIIFSYGGNCHNSFIQLHAYNGLIMLIVFVIMLVRSVIYYWKKQQFVMVTILAVLVLRGMTDKFIFGQYGMPIMLFLILYPMINEQNDCNKFIVINDLKIKRSSQ